ncbi:MAG: response regulator [Myxococcaceae bacterium]
MSLVLVADDEAAVLEVLSEVVEDLGHEVVQARDGREALALARARIPALVVTDHLMPVLSGVELCKLLRKDERLKSVPVILLSAAPPKGLVEGCTFLSKPFELVDFEAMVKQLVGR